MDLGPSGRSPARRLVRDFPNDKRSFHGKTPAVAGAYGIALDGQRGGNILYLRTPPLHEPLSLPRQAQSLDELLIAIRADSGLFMDEHWRLRPLRDRSRSTSSRARTAVLLSLVIYCEHWSSTPKFRPFPEETLMRIARSAEYFRVKWARRLPILTPCISLTHPGSAATQIQGNPCPSVKAMDRTQSMIGTDQDNRACFIVTRPSTLLHDWQAWLRHY